MGIIDDSKRWVGLGIVDESKRWVELGIIDDTARENILALYHKKRSKNPVYVLFAILGSLLLGLGVILIFATNWENIPRGLKVCIAFVPLIASMCIFLYTLFKRRESAAFREGAALGLSLSIFATVALISQIFHIPLDTLEYVRLCMLLTLPAIYLLEAKSPAAIYVGCVISTGFAVSEAAAFLNVILIVPFLVLQIKKINQKTVIWYLSILSGSLLAFLMFKLLGNWVVSSITTFSCLIFLITLEEFISRQKKLSGIMPLTVISCLYVIGMLMVYSFRGSGVYTSVLDSIIARPESLLLLICAAIIYAAVRFYKQPVEIKMVDAVVLCAILGFPLHWLWSNILLAALGIWFIAAGVRNLNISIKLVNCGMLLLISLITIRFFDSGLGMMERGIAFIVVGIGFILTNLLLYRKRKAVQEKGEYLETDNDSDI